MKSSLGQGIAVAAMRRQSTRVKFIESQPSPLLLSTQSLEGVVWIQKYKGNTLDCSHIFTTTGIILGTQLHTHKVSEVRVSNTTSAFSNTKVRIYHFSCCSKLKNQDTAVNSRIQQVCVDGKSVQSPCCMEMAGCVLFYWQHSSPFHKQLYSICCSSSLRLLLVIYQGRFSPTTYILEAIYITIHTCAL